MLRREQIKLLRIIFYRFGNNPYVREKVLEGIRSGMRERAAQMKKEGKPLTTETLIHEIAADKELLSVFAKAGIFLSDFKAIAEAILKDETLKGGGE